MVGDDGCLSCNNDDFCRPGMSLPEHGGSGNEVDSLQQRWLQIAIDSAGVRQSTGTLEKLPTAEPSCYQAAGALWRVQ